MSNFELLLILFIAACFLLGLAAIVMEEKEEPEIFKIWRK